MTQYKSVQLSQYNILFTICLSMLFKSACFGMTLGVFILHIICECSFVSFSLEAAYY